MFTLSPLDGRYEHLVIELQTICSEFGLVKNRFYIGYNLEIC